MIGEGGRNPRPHPFSLERLWEFFAEGTLFRDLAGVLARDLLSGLPCAE